ncbi:PepSY-associated TM helix domain-containing protein [Galbibacter sp. PAP.153]|uniref:PepSY-associated TM helix domain-containing protein n=1 Tax=Galbibacter sp. PAP.153 TaxID=3104623 RepID=UPI00300B6EA2
MNNRVLLKYHSVFGIIAGIFLCILGITGSILIFNEDFDSKTFKEYKVDASSDVLHLDLAIANIQQEFPKWNTRIIHFKKGETIVFNIRRPDARRLVFVHPETGNIIGNIDENALFTKWLLKLHYSLHSGLIGRFLVLFAGICFLLSILTGIVLYRKVIIKTLLFKTKVKTANKRSFYSAMHRYVGVWALILNLILVITGIFLAYKVVQSGMVKAKTPAPPLVTASLEKSLKNIQDNTPDFNATYIRLPSTKEGTITVNGTFANDPFFYSQYYNKIQLDYATGAIEQIVKTKEQPLVYKLNSMILPLHFGQYAGIFGKILYAFIGLSGPFLSITGYFIWYIRRKQ